MSSSITRVGRSVSSTADDHLFGLELLRFIAALGVLVWHYQHFRFIGHASIMWDTQLLPFRWLFRPFYAYGYQSVELFWCISGFIFTWKYARPVSRTSIGFGRFVWLRFSRLYPLHLITLLLVAGLQYIYFERHGETFVYLFNDTRHFLLNLLYANWWGFQSGESFNGPSWSVSAEVLIYIIFFWLCRLVGTGWRIDLFALLGFSVATWIAKMLFGIKLDFTGAGTFFYIGALLLPLYQWMRTLGQRRRRQIITGCFIVPIVCAALVVTRVLAIAGASLAIFPALVLLAQLTIQPRTARMRYGLSALGNLTYASYMVHFPMQLAAVLLLESLAVSVQPLVYHDWFMLAYLASVLIVSFAVFHWVERPAQNRLRDLGRSSQSQLASVLAKED